MSDYVLQMKGHNRREVEKEHDMHLQAWLNARVKDTDKQGKLIYKKFIDFYDYEKRRHEVFGDMKRPPNVSNNMKKALQMACEINT